MKLFGKCLLGVWCCGVAAMAPTALAEEDNRGPTPTPTPEEAGELVFAEDFEEGVARWEVKDPGSWTLRELEDGNTVYGIHRRESDYTPPMRSPKHLALIEDLDLDSFVMTFRVRNPHDTGGHRDCCVFLAYQNPRQFYYAHLGAEPEEVSGQVLVVDEAARAPISHNEKPIPWTDDWHTVKVVRDASSGRIAVYFDDMTTPHLTATDTRFGEGRIGIGSFDDVNDFDDIRIWKLAETTP